MINTMLYFPPNVGEVEGDNVVGVIGSKVGDSDVVTVGVNVTTVGVEEGERDFFIKSPFVGFFVGFLTTTTPRLLGFLLGRFVRRSLGEALGKWLGTRVLGKCVGFTMGDCEGAEVLGDCVGDDDGCKVDGVLLGELDGLKDVGFLLRRSDGLPVEGLFEGAALRGEFVGGRKGLVVAGIVLGVNVEGLVVDGKPLGFEVCGARLALCVASIGINVGTGVGKPVVAKGIGVASLLEDALGDAVGAKVSKFSTACVVATGLSVLSSSFSRNNRTGRKLKLIIPL